MDTSVDTRVCVVVPNWNGMQTIKKCLDSLFQQTLKAHIIVVDNGSADDSVGTIAKNYPQVELISLPKNIGYAGGVNAGLKRAIELQAEYVAPFNNDAVADASWLELLVGSLDGNEGTGIAVPKVLDIEGKAIDSTGEMYTVWGLPYPRGRGENELDKYDSDNEIFGGSGAASLYRVSMLQAIGLFDEDFFAYFEDVDLSFRARLAGYDVSFVGNAIVRHLIGATSGKIKGFTTYQTFKNLPVLLLKNMPRRYLFSVGWRLLLAESVFFIKAVLRGHGWAALKGVFVALGLLPSTLKKRRQIQGNRKIDNDELWRLITHDVPPASKGLKMLKTIGR